MVVGPTEAIRTERAKAARRWASTPVAGGDFEEVDHLLRRGERRGADLAGDDGGDPPAERAEVVGQGPAVDRDLGDGRPAVVQAVDQLGAGLAVFLDGDPEAGDRDLGVEGGQQLAPGVRLGGGQVDADLELAERGRAAWGRG